jgi:hypothetical protein
MSRFRGTPSANHPLRFVVDEFQTFHTPIGPNETTGTHMVGVWDVMNASNGDLVLLKARLKRYPNCSALVGVRYCTDTNYEPKRALSARRMARVMIDLVFQPPIHSQTRP